MTYKTKLYVVAIVVVAVLFVGYQKKSSLDQSKDVGPGGYEMSVEINRVCDRTRELGRALHKSKADGIPIDDVLKTVRGDTKVDAGLRRAASQIYAQSLTSAEAEQLAWAICKDSLSSSR